LFIFLSSEADYGYFFDIGDRGEVDKMQVVIIGDGKVGHKLTMELSEEDYDIVLIDQNEGKLRETVNDLDVAYIAGDGIDANVQRQADVPNSDLVVACTSSDELNMLCCLIARRLGARHTIARVRNPVYYQQIDLLREDLHLSMVVNPELILAGAIARLLIIPDASKVETFMKERVDLVEFTLRPGHSLAGLALKEIYRKTQIKILVCAVVRGTEVFIPSGEFVLQAGDKLHIAAPHAQMEEFFHKHGSHKHKVKTVLVCGGGRVSYYLARQLEAIGMQVKIIEQDLPKCEQLCSLLPKATIIHGDAADQELLQEEGIDHADALVALTGMDETNIIMGLFAKTRGVDKIIVKVNEDARAQMVEGLGIDSIVSAKAVTADAIVSYVRARQNSLKHANVETMYQLVGGKVEALEFIIKGETKYTNIPLKDLPIKPNNLVACIGRKRQIIIPGGDDTMKVGDSVIVVSMGRKIQDIESIFE